MAVNPELEAQIVANPDDPAPYRVYADWLQSQGDPRGDLIALSLREEETRYKKIRERLIGQRRALFDRHLPELLGPLLECRDQLQPVWHRGFLQQLSLVIAPGREVHARNVKLLGPILDHEGSRLLRRVRMNFVITAYAQSVEMLEAVTEALVSRRLPLFDSLELMQQVMDQDVVVLSPLLSRMHHLSMDQVWLTRFAVAELPELRSFSALGPSQAWRDFGRTARPKLESLRLCSSLYEGAIGDLAWLFDGRITPNLRTLTIDLVPASEHHELPRDVAGRIIRELVESLEHSALLSSLESVSLELIRVDDEAIESLLTSRPALLAKLKKLSLRSRWPDDGARDRLRALLGNVVTFPVQPW